jgi:predicted protein tyrosine phosphatase
VKRVLFVCSRNRLRSPTAETVFSSWPDIDVASAGLDHDADVPLSGELIDWADLIFVMERKHRTKLSKNFARHLRHQRIVCLDIPDDFEFMDPDLIELLKARVTRHL